MEYHIFFSAHFSSHWRFYFPFYTQLVVSSKLGPLNVEVPSHPRSHVVLIVALHLGFILVHFTAVRIVTARLRNRNRSLGAELGSDQELDHAISATPGGPEDCGLVSTW